ncbi:hypothetical protein ESV85_17995 [Algoriphagus aquimarinus]|uniref:Uncharacterized protein n=1 Tax=Algoriphagus aquimarinus TaxID=237018 RepID=A0A5C7AGC0_9BACT|nr:hypothetical protein ESV85_17995 [Algoriphagus aquimarinus]
MDFSFGIANGRIDKIICRDREIPNTAIKVDRRIIIVFQRNKLIEEIASSNSEMFWSVILKLGIPDSSSIGLQLKNEKVRVIKK